MARSTCAPAESSPKKHEYAEKHPAQYRYSQSKHGNAVITAYRNSEAYKEAHKRALEKYNQSPKGVFSRYLYEQSKKGKEVHRLASKKYSKTEQCKKASRRYKRSKKGWETIRKLYRQNFKKKRQLSRETPVLDKLDTVLGKSFRDRSFYDLKSEEGTRLRVDAWYPQHNLIIEYNGKQHYGNGKQQKTYQKRESIKKRWCSDKNIRFIVVPFTVTNEEVIEWVKNRL